MGLRFFADHCVSNAIVQTLREGGHEVMRLREHLPVESPDSVVIAKAQSLDAILSSHADREYYRGKLLVVDFCRIRVRK